MFEKLLNFSILILSIPMRVLSKVKMPDLFETLHFCRVAKNIRPEFFHWPSI